MGVDHKTGIVHTLEVTSANKHDVRMTAELLTGEEEVVYGDSGYLGAKKRPEAVTKNKSGKCTHCKINRRLSQSRHNPMIQSTDQAQRAGKIFRTSERGTCLCCCEAATAFPENAIPRSTKTGRKIKYPVCAGESDSG